MSVAAASRPEIWGGVECTVNRIGSAYMDQLALSGHEDRETDLERFAELGIKAIRYPVLWERTAPRGMASADWSWADARLAKLQQLELPAIVGLVHHGSGPLHTQLDDSAFADGLAEFAGAVARRYPWVDRYCPVNEPLTTARFSGLYGHWYPHGRSDRVFARALVNECRAVVLAMKAIRAVNREATLVQTEDLAKIYSTPSLAYQADFENDRRWATFDLLTGKLERNGLVWSYLTWAGMGGDELEWFLDNPVENIVLGCNYYIVGERLLDDRLEHYPKELHGGNGRQAYVDVEAVRGHGIDLAGWRGLLREAWQRYHLPLALTEVQLHCHREAQLCWLLDAWRAGCELCDEGVDVRAVTAWSLLGSYNWSSLATQDTGHYESGVFEVGRRRLRPTALAKAVRSLASGGEVAHPACATEPWWQRPNRFLYPAIHDLDVLSPPAVWGEAMTCTQPIMIIGRGTLGTGFVRACRDRCLQHVVVRRPDVDIIDRESIERAISDYRPWAVINAAGYTHLKRAEGDALTCHRINAVGAKNVARTCARHGMQLLTFSSDLVFGGGRNSPFVERDPIRPLSTYGRSKAAGERRVMTAYPDALVVRSAAFFSPYEPYNFLAAALDRMANGLPTQAACDWVVSPTYVPDLAHRALDLLIDGERGIWHIANDGAVSWADVVELSASLLGLESRLVRRCRSETLGGRARRPSYSALASERGHSLPALQDALARFCHEWTRAADTAGNERKQAS